MAKNINNPNQEKNDSQTEEFFKKNGRKLSYTGVALILVAAIIVLVIQFYSKPMKAEAVSQTFTAEQYFRAEDYDKALNGDGNALGFAQIIDEYGAKAGKAVYLYAGICEQLSRQVQDQGACHEGTRTGLHRRCLLHARGL